MHIVYYSLVLVKEWFLWFQTEIVESHQMKPENQNGMMEFIII